MQAAGGLGLFLLGMIVMSSGLHALAGNAIRAALMRFTSSPTTGALTGAASTAILQSSSATTVAAVGFVGAGLLSFPSALGIIFGANIGTTITGWLVVLLGFKLKISALAMPLVLVGALIKLLTRGKVSHVGYAIAGFGLVFIGISEMQQGMAGMQQFVTPDSFPSDTLLGRLQLAGIGIAITVVTQSSSAGVAATLTALFTGTINFPQAAALIIGMDIGTTVTAALATIGGNVEARRTGLSHVIYNLLTGAGALILITPYVAIWEMVSAGLLNQNPSIALVAFHTSFNIIGVLAILPFTTKFATFIESLITEKKTLHTNKLDKNLLRHPGLALLALQETIQKEFILLLEHINYILSAEIAGQKSDLEELQRALDQTHVYLDHIQLDSSGGEDWKKLLEVSHCMDHLQRLHERCEEDEDRAITARERMELRELHTLLTEAVDNIVTLIKDDKWIEVEQEAQKASSEMLPQVGPLREKFMMKIASNEMDVPKATGCLEAIRWMERVSTHIARIGYHIKQLLLLSGK